MMIYSPITAKYNLRKLIKLITFRRLYDITYSPMGSHGEHATSLYYNGNPSLELVVRSSREIRIPEPRCLEIIRQVERVCEQRLPVIHRLTEA